MDVMFNERTKMPNKPLVSVIIPTYNRAKVLSDAVNSAIQQTYKNIEIIIIDDGSSDETESLCSKLSVTYFKQNNAGASAARNTGIKRSNGEYIAFLDSDDIWHSEKIEKQLNFLSKHPDVGLVHTDTEIVNFCDKYSFDIIKERRFDDIRSIESVVRNPYFGLPSVMIHRRVLDDVGLFDETLNTAEDLDLFLRTVMKYKIGYLNEVLLIVRKGSDNISEGSNSYEDNEVVFNRFFEKNRNQLSNMHNLENDVYYRLNVKYAGYLLSHTKKSEARRRLREAIKYRFGKEAIYLYLKSFIPSMPTNSIKN